MNRETLYGAIGDIQDAFILQAREQRKKRLQWRRLCAMAACVCLVIGALFLFRNGSVGPEGILDGVYAYTVSFVGWANSDVMFQDSLNGDILRPGILNNEQPIPVFKMDSLDALNRFKTKFSDSLTMDRGYGDVLSFDAALSKAQWDREVFFEDHALIVVYVSAGSGSYRYGIQKVDTTDTTFCVRIEQKNDPDVCTDDMAGWFVAVALEKEEAVKYTTFDALLVSEE